jgi:hypothetical protein
MDYSHSIKSNSGIYVLKCPKTKLVKYVGQTINFTSRKRAHLAGGKTLRLMFWFNELKQQNLKPIFEIYLVCDDQKIKDKVEKRLILKLEKDLLNARHGGINNGSEAKTYKFRWEYNT